MAIVADTADIVIGVDTHKNTHAVAIVRAATGAHEQTITIDATPDGYCVALAAAAAVGGSRCWAIEGCGSWGRAMFRWLADRDEPVVEIDRPKRPHRRMGVKDDATDALRAAREALAGDRAGTPRATGERDALAALLAARRSAMAAATDAERQLLALANTAPEVLAAKLRHNATAGVVAVCARWRTGSHADASTRHIADVMQRLARRAQKLRREANALEETITAVVESWRPEILNLDGVGPIVAAVVLCAWSHPGHVRSEAAFAMLAGVAPIPASSGQTVRHRLNRQGDRQLNWALHIVCLQRLRRDERTQRYATRRRAEGKTDREIRRCLKRYIARELYRTLEPPLDRS